MDLITIILIIMVFVVAAIVYFSYKRSVKETKQFVDNLVKAHCDFLLTVANTNLLHDDRAVFFRISTSYNFAALHDPGISKENIISIQKKILLDMSQSQDKMSCIAFFELLLRVATAIYPTAKNESKLDMLNLMCLYITCIHAIQTDLSTHMTDFVNFYNLFILGQPDVTINMLVMSLAGEKKFEFLRIQSYIYHRLRTLYSIVDAPEAKALQVTAIKKALDNALLKSTA